MKFSEIFSVFVILGMIIGFGRLLYEIATEFSPSWGILHTDVAHGILGLLCLAFSACCFCWYAFKCRDKALKDAGIKD